MELFFFAGNVFAGRRCARSKSPLDGCGCSDGHQTITNDDLADYRRDLDRSVWNHWWRAHRADRLDPSLRNDDSRAALAS